MSCSRGLVSEGGGELAKPTGHDTSKSVCNGCFEKSRVRRVDCGI